MKKLMLFLTFTFSVFGVYAQQAAAAKDQAIEERTGKVSQLGRLASTITVDELTRHLTILSSDEFEGRETGTAGEEKARNYIAGIFESYGLPPVGDNGTYFQQFSYISENWDDISLKINGELINHLGDFFSIPAKNSDLELNTNEVVFLGYGIDDANYSDYKGQKVNGKVLLVFDGEPDKNGIYLLSGSNEPSEWTTNLDKKLKAANRQYPSPENYSYLPAFNFVYYQRNPAQANARPPPDPIK